MRKWGPVLAVLLVVGYVGSLFSPDPEPSAAPEQTSQSALPTRSTTEETEEPTAEPTAESPAPEPEVSEPVEDETEPTAEPSETETTEPEPSPSASETETAAPEPSAEPAVEESQPASDEISELLLSLTIEAEFEGAYDRSFFGDWIDADRDGCSTRREVLLIEAIEAPTIGANCTLIGGLWYSAYDGVFESDDSLFDIDHMVPLSEAWDSGASEWTREQRVAFSNDLDLPQALIAVTRSTNRSKGDKDPADWLPPLPSYHCQYVEDWVRVKVKWQLSVDQREFAAIRDILATC